MNGKDTQSASTGPNEPAVAIDALRAALDEARRIGRRLYAHLTPEARDALGDVSEWPWLLEPGHPPRDESSPRSRTIEVTREQLSSVLRTAARESRVQSLHRGLTFRDRDILRAYAALQEQGEDLHGASEHVADILAITAEGFDASLSRLIAGGYLTGGKTFARSYVEAVTDRGLQETASGRRAMES